ncbi:hypothetical protein [Cohnella soli]|uniref:Uncharacterized protein n=1 Tax=Cohnella soli TaxID=425005 RepID=A0ABW0HWB2_9BACL
MQNKFQFVVKELNQPSDKAVRQFHQHVFDWISRTTESGQQYDNSPQGIEHSTQTTDES